MSLLRAIRGRLMLRLLLSYLIVIAVGTLVLASAAQLTVPSAFNRHMYMMRGMQWGMMGDDATADGLPTPELAGFYAESVREALLLAGGASLLVALVVSVVVSQRVVSPVRAMMLASRHIAAGHYGERVAVPGDVASGNLDELGQLAVAFNQMASTLERTEAIRRELIADVVHELRTPLASIKGYMEALVDDVVPADAETFERVHKEAERLQRLVQDLQELSRVEAGAFELKLEPSDLGALVRAVASHLERQFEEKDVGLELHVTEDLPRVRLDGDRLQQVLLNLLGNALQYTPTGGNVRLSAGRAAGEVVVSVADTGIGIAPEHLQRVFTRFYRVDRSRSRASGGTGIGLTIAKYLVEAHGGRIWAESDGPGRGSTFSFALPL